MQCIQRFSCCALIVTMVGCFSNESAGQSDDSPFKSTPQQPAAQRTDDDPFGRDVGARSPQRAPATAPAERPQAAAPQAAAAPAGDLICNCLGENPQTAARIRTALKGPLHPRGLHFDDAPLEEVVVSISQEYGIPMLLDQRALADAGQGPADTVKTHLNGIGLRSALKTMLRQLNLTFIIRDEVLLVTTPAEAEKQLAAWRDEEVKS